MIRTVRIIKNWNWPDLNRQTPGNSMEWEGIIFTEEPLSESDLVVVLNKVSVDEKIRVTSGEIWCLVQEPPVPEYEWLKRGYPKFTRVYQQDCNLKGKKLQYSHGALPWHVNKSYDELTVMNSFEKSKNISAIISKVNENSRPGNIKRYDFVNDLRKNIDFDWFGKGFQFIEDKWDGLAPYRYSIAIENTKKKDYWTEKISDCFLAFTMPIYDGCLNIDRYFPKESYIQIDLDRPSYSADKIKDLASIDYYKENMNALLEAREKVLNEHQLFPFIYNKINEMEIHQNKAKKIKLRKVERIHKSFIRKAAGRIKRIITE